MTILQGNSVVHTATGQLFLGFGAALNTNPTSDGEFAALDEITDGTGSFGSTSGYLQLRGTFTGGVENGEYAGVLVTP